MHEQTFLLPYTDHRWLRTRDQLSSHFHPDRLSLPEEEQLASYEVIDAVEAQVESGKPSKAVVKTLLNGLPNAGSIASIGSFLVSLLG